MHTPTLPPAQAEPLHPENQWQRAEKPQPLSQSPTGGHSESLEPARGRGAEPGLGSSARFTPLLPPPHWPMVFYLVTSKSVFQHPLLPNRPFSLLPSLNRDGWSWLWAAEGTAWVTGTWSGRGALAARYSPPPSPPHTPGAEERPYLAACKDDRRAGWLGSVRDGDTLRGRLGDRQRGQVRHRALLAPTAPSSQPTPPPQGSALHFQLALWGPGQCHFFLTLGTGPREDTQEHGRAVGDTMSCSRGPA